jgi:6-phosphogluconolactonase (cycloisomerase 2 family)
MLRTKIVTVAVAALAALMAAVSATAAPPPPAPQGGPPPARVVGQVYVNDNTAPVNTVAAFNRLADGTLTPVAGSPFAVGGAGTGHPDASQGSLELSADGRYLLAVDAGSNQISVLRIKPDGSLQIAEGSPVASNGVDPVSIAVSGDLVYVANAGPGTNPGDTNYTGFKLDPGGHLRAIPDSTYALPSDSKPGDVLFNRDGNRLVGARIASSQIDSFTVGHDGHLTTAPGSPYDAQAFSPAQGYGQLGSEFSPTKPDELFVSDAHVASGGPAPGLVSSFTDAADGTLTPIAGSPVSNDGIASCWVEISHDGNYLFAVNTASATISSYSIGSGGTLTFLHSTLSGEIGAGAEDARLSPDGSTLWVVESGTNAVTGFSVSGGTLTPLASAAGPAGATPSGIVVT